MSASFGVLAGSILHSTLSHHLSKSQALGLERARIELAAARSIEPAVGTTETPQRASFTTSSLIGKLMRASSFDKLRRHRSAVLRLAHRRCAAQDDTIE